MSAKNCVLITSTGHLSILNSLHKLSKFDENEVIFLMLISLSSFHCTGNLRFSKL